VARLLVADDNPPLLAALADSLRAAGHEVTATESGADALCLLHAKPSPDLLILDLLMPGLSGYDVLKHLGPTAPPVIVITGEIGDEVLESTLDQGTVKRVLLKPFDQTALLAAVNDALKRPAASAEICP
jgi:two-component system, OmpR family, response regulator